MSDGRDRPLDLQLQLVRLSAEINEEHFVRHHAVAAARSAAGRQIFRREHQVLHDHTEKLALVLVRPTSDGGHVRRRGEESSEKDNVVHT